MSTFSFGVKAGTVPDTFVSAALGVDVNTKLSDADAGKVVKLIGDSRYGLASDGDGIEGFLIGVQPNTVNNGFSFGTVQVKEQRIVRNAGAASIAVGAFVVAAAQPARGTAIALVSSGKYTGEAAAPVRVATAPELAATVFKWRVTALLGGAGAVGAPMLIERVN